MTMGTEMSTDDDFDFDPAGVRARPPVSQALPSYLKALNPPQREAALTTEGPLIVLAGAGSGKTKMLTGRITYLIDHLRVRPQNVLAVTFTNKAAAEMRDRVARNLAEAAEHSQGGPLWGAPEIGTFHSVCVRILRNEMHCTGFTKPFVIYDDSDQLSLIKTTLEKLGLDQKQTNPKAIRAAINDAKCDAREPHEIEVYSSDRFSQTLQRVYDQYQKDLLASNALDFGEILCMTYRILRDHPDVRARYQQRFQYIHVDEYQDTNRAQYLLLAMLAQKQYGGHGNLCVVGDEDQSIYKWRGADIRNILDFERDFPGAAVVKLEQNYRSTRNIIEAASELISHNTERKNKRLWTENRAGDPILRIQFADERAEAEMVGNEVQRQIREEGRDPSDFAIFYRTHAQSRQFEEVFGRDRVPYQIIGGVRFYDRREIKDILAYFRVIMNPSDSVSLLRIINVPGRGIGKTTLNRLQQLLLESESLWAALSRAIGDDSIFAGGTRRKLADFVALMSRLINDQPKLSVSELYHAILDATGYVRDLRTEGTPEAEARVENLEELDTILQEFEEDFFAAAATSAGPTAQLDDAARAALKPQLLSRFLERATLVSEEEQAANEAGERGTAVRLMTLHAAKGLEFPVVFMVGMEEGLFPSTRPWEETPPEEIEEERRLCYVGMTRAREKLIMTHAVMRRLWGSTHYHEPARFFSEISPERVNFIDRALFARKSASPSWSGSGFSERAPARSFPRKEPQSTATRYYDDANDVVYAGGGSGGVRAHIGRHIEHPEYGTGKIVATEGSGDMEKVVVEFDGRTRRKFLLRYVTGFLE